MPHVAASDRYDRLPYRRVGNSGLQLPAVSLGLWQNFGGDRAVENCRAILLRAFDLGVTHFDLANNYGPPYGSAEETFGTVLDSDLRRYRDELIVSTKAGYDMWPGPYGIGGSRKYLLASLDQSLRRMRVDYVDIFYSHRFDPDTRLEETMGALATAVLQGKALYAGVSSYSAARTRDAAGILAAMGSPPTRCSTAGSRAQRAGSLRREMLSEENMAKVRALNEIARRRGQTLAQMAIAWVLRDRGVTSALVGASSVAQLEANLAATASAPFTDDDLAEIDRYATDSGINIWAESSRW